MARSSVRLGRTGLLVALAAAASCTIPNFEGPQVQEPPRGFLRNDESFQQRRIFPDRDLTMHTAWIKSTDGPYSAIYVNGHRGAISLDQVAEAQQARKAVVDGPVTFSDVEAMEIDGRTAWGWEERLETPERGLDWVAYRTVVAYDTVSYAIEFYSGDPRIKPASPDTLKAVIATFGIGRTTYNFPLIGFLLAVLVLGVQYLRNRRELERARLRGINLVQVPKKKDGDGGPEGDPTPDRAAHAPHGAGLAGRGGMPAPPGTTSSGRTRPAGPTAHPAAAPAPGPGPSRGGVATSPEPTVEVEATLGIVPDPADR